MSYSVPNVNNLRFIYCESKPQSEWAAFENALKSHFDETITTAFKKKQEVYCYSLFNKMLELLDWGNWGFYRGVFEQPDYIFDLKIMDNPDEFADFIMSIITELAHSFRHEILRMSKESCEQLTHNHASQIFDCLNKAAHLDKSITRQQLTTQILDCLDPDPKEEIEKRIDAYINALFKLPLAPSFENFLNNLKVKLNGPNPDVEQLIDHLSQSVFFFEQKSLAQQSQLGMSNPYLTRQADVAKHQSEGESKKLVIKDHPLLKGLPNSQTRTISDVLLLLMRLHIKTTRANADQSLEVTKELKQRSIEQVTLNIKILKGNTKHLVKMLSENDPVRKLHEISRDYHAEKPYDDSWSNITLGMGGGNM